MRLPLVIITLLSVSDPLVVTQILAPYSAFFPTNCQYLAVFQTPLQGNWWTVALCIVGLGSILWYIRKLIVAKEIEKQRKKQLTESRMLELERKALHAQMNPHFIFNCLNSIQRYVLDNNAQDAYDYTVKFSRLMRSVLQNSQQESVTLGFEVEALSLYLELEQLRFKNKFSFTIDVNPSIDLNLLIPPMLIHPYVENAVWHGLMLKENQATLKIEIEKKNDQLLIIIEDNGIGRIAASAIRKDDQNHHSSGLHITQARINTLNSQFQKCFSVQIIDLFNNNKGCGTRVEILMHPEFSHPSNLPTYASKSFTH